MPLSAARSAPRPDPQPLTVVVNGRASGVGRADADSVLHLALAVLREHGADADGIVTYDLGELADVVAGVGGGRLVLVGGDGAVHALANVEAPLPEVALLPAGRANNIAHALGIPTDRPAAAALAVAGAARIVDALLVETPERTVVAVEGVSAGFHAAARHRYGAENSAALAEGVRAFADELRVFAPYAAELVLDGDAVAEGPLAQLFLANLPLFGFGFRVDPVARPDDGLLEAVALRAGTRAGVARLIAAARRGHHLDRPDVAWRRVEEARIETPLPLVADAETLGVTTARVSVLPGWLRLVAPEGDV